MKLLLFGFWLALVLGLAGTIIFGIAAWIDWGALQKAWKSLETANTPEALQRADIRQSAHRINLFAEGVWTLLAAILATLGGLGLQRKAVK
ncbi:MAG: hypothetical protein QM758_09935 [Armatimonas sp.]